MFKLLQYKCQEIKAINIPSCSSIIIKKEIILIICLLFKTKINEYYCTIIPSVAFFGSGKFPNS